MATTPGPDLNPPALGGEPLSPELALVCPELAERARALLPERPEFPLVRHAVAAEAVAPAASTAADERLDAVAERVEQIAAGGLLADARLAQLEGAVERLEVVAADAAAAPVPRPAHEPRQRSALVAAALFVAVVVAVPVAVELLPLESDRPRLVAAPPRGDAATTESPRAPRGGSEPAPARTETAARTDTTVPESPVTQPPVTQPTVIQPPVTQPRPRPPSAPPTVARPAETAPPPPPAAAAPTVRSTPPATAPAAGAVEPARVFAWVADERATGYLVTFLRNGRLFYSTRVGEPRFTLPEGLEWRPGSYRWTVRPFVVGLAPGAPIVDSTFTVAQP